MYIARFYGSSLCRSAIKLAQQASNFAFMIHGLQREVCFIFTMIASADGFLQVPVRRLFCSKGAAAPTVAHTKSG
jgi:hypothetical protein